MKTHQQIQPVILRRLAAISLLLLLCGSRTTKAADTTTSAWNGGTTAWATPGNWGANGVPSVTVSALFNSTFANQPTLSAAQTSQGIWLASSVGQDVTINSAAAQVLTITGSATLNGQANAGIIMSDTANHNLTIGANTSITLGASTGFYNNEASGQLNISGSISGSSQTLTIGGTGIVNLSGGATLSVLLVNGNGGTVKITGGTVTGSASGNAVDKGATLEIDSGGTLTLGSSSSFFPIGNTASTTSTLWVNGGTVTMNGINGEQVSRIGNGILTISSGSYTDNSGNAKGLSMGDTSGTTGGTVNLNGGTLAVPVIRSPRGTGSSGAVPCFFYFNGGTLKASVTPATAFFSVNSGISAQVRNNGGIMDNNGYAITIGQNLLHSAVGGDNATDGGMTFTDSGAAATTTLTGASTYTGRTAINGGTVNAGGAQTGTTSGPLGANGSITFGGGTLQYSSTFGAVDLSPRIAAGTSSGAISLDLNGQNVTFGTALTSSQSGGLTLNDTAATKGSLTLSGANGYTGNTTVTAGNLILAASASLGAGAVNVNGGSLTLNSGSSIGGAVSVAAGLTLTAKGNDSVNGLTLASGATTVSLTADNAANTLTLGNGLTLANNNVLSFNVATAGSDQINVTGGTYSDSAVSTGSKVQINLTAIGSGLTAAGTIDLITLASGSIDLTKFTLNTAVLNGYLLSLQTANSGKTLQLLVSAASSPTVAYWKGASSASWGTLANWTSDSAGTTALTVLPGGGVTAVNFSTASAGNLATTLDASYDIFNLTFNSASGTVGIDLGNNSLTNESASAITLNSGAGAVTLSASGSGSYVLPVDQTIANASSSALTISAPITGAHNLTVNSSGSGVTTLAGVNTHGNTVVSAGELDLNTTGGQSIPGNLTVSGGTAKLLQANQINSAKNVTVSSGTFNLQGNNQTVAGAQLTGGSITGSGALTSASAFDLQSGTASTVLAGSVGVNKSGSGTVTLSGANAYTGPTVISNGVLSVSSINSVAGGGASSSLGAPTTTANGTITLGSATATGELSYTGGGETSDRVINLGGTTGGAIIDQSGSGLLKFTSDLTATGSGTKTLTLQGSTTGTGELDGAVASSASTSLTKLGSGTWTLAGAGKTTTFGNLAADGGTLKISAGTVSVTGATAGGTLVDQGGALEMDAGGILTIANAASFVPIGNTASTTSTLFVNGGAATNNAQNGTQVGRVGYGILTLAGGSFTDNSGNSKGVSVGDTGTANTGGTINLNGGVLTANVIRSVTGTGGSGNVPCFFYFNGGTLKAGATPATAFLSTGGRMSDQVRNNGGTVDNGGGAITIADSLLHSAVGGDNVTDGGMSFQGAGVTTLTGASTYNGPTAINGGVVNAGSAQTGTTSGPLGANGAITFGGGTLQYSATIGASWDPSPRIAAGTSSGAVTIDPSGLNVTFGTTLTSSQSGGLTLNDTAAMKGSLTLSGANTYTGNTTVAAGNLILANGTSLAAGSAVAVNSGSLTIRGSATVNGSLTLATGTTNNLTGDSAAGTLTLANGLTLNNNDALNFDVATAGSDLINVTGGVYSDASVGAGNPVLITLTSIGSGITAVGTIDLITLTGTATGVFDLTKFNLTTPSVDGFALTLQTANSGKTLQLSVTAGGVPPPTISTQPTSQIVVNGNSANFSVVASGDAPLTYQWYKNNVAISSAGNNTTTNATFTIGAVSPTDMGSYKVVVQNPGGSVTSSNVALTVNSAMSYGTLVPANGATGVCYDTPLYLTFSQTPTLQTSGTIKIFNAANDAVVDTIDLSLCVTNNATYAANVQPYTIGGQTFTNFPVIITGNTAAIYPHHGLLTYGQTYYVTVDDGTFADSAGAYFAGISTTTAWRFTTKSSGPLNATNLVVAADGGGDFVTVQGAVDSVAGGNTTPTIINIRNGIYTEVVNVNSRNKLDFRGQSRSGAIIGYPNNSWLNGGAPWRASWVVNGNDCTLENLTLTNQTPKGGSQAEAVDVEGTRAIFYNMELDSYQDTFLVHSAGKLVYFQDCLIQGDTDFNWGYGTVYYTNCELRCLTAGGRVTQPRSPYTTNGFGFFNCRITKGYSGSSAFSLGRSIGTPTTPSEVLYANCLMDDVVTGYDSDAGTNFSDYACSNLTATAAKTLANSTHLASSDPYAIAVQSASTWLYGWQPATAPNITSQPANQSASHGQSANFVVSATGIPAPGYQWLFNGAPITGATGSTFAIASAVRTNGGNYSVVVSNASGSVTSSVVVLAYNNTAPVAQTMTVSRTAGLSVKVSLADLSTNWSDVDGDSIALSSIALFSTNNVNLRTNSNWIVYTNSANVNDQISYGISDNFGGTNIGYINIVLSSSATSSNSIASYSFGSNSNIITAYGIPGYTYILERATNLSPAVWIDVSTNNSGTNGLINAVDAFGDLGNSAPASAFYRLKWQP